MPRNALPSRRRIFETRLLSPPRRRLVDAHQSGYNFEIKRRDLERQLRRLGWRFERHGGRHDVWTDGEREEAVPRHREIAERLAATILARAAKGRKL